MWAAAPGCAQQLQGALHLPWTVPAAVLMACGSRSTQPAPEPPLPPPAPRQQPRVPPTLQLRSTSLPSHVFHSMQASRPCAASATSCGWRHSAACRSRRPARTPLPPRAAGKKHEHDLHNLNNVDASQMQSDPGDLGR